MFEFGLPEFPELGRSDHAEVAMALRAMCNRTYVVREEVNLPQSKSVRDQAKEIGRTLNTGILWKQVQA